jgi:undecaprenyl-diphosphatase
MLAWLQALDGYLLLWIQDAVRCPALDAVLIPFTNLGNAGRLWIVLSLLMLCAPKIRRAGGLTLLALLFGLLVTNLTLKPWVMRPRPWLSIQELIPLVSPGDPYSFPSGHATAAFAAAGIWARAFPRRWMKAIAILQAAVMAFTRLYVGVHFPTDVLAGMCVGLLGSQLIWFGAKKWDEKKYGKQL